MTLSYLAPRSVYHWPLERRLGSHWSLASTVRHSDAALDSEEDLVFAGSAKLRFRPPATRDRCSSSRSTLRGAVLLHADDLPPLEHQANAGTWRYCIDQMSVGVPSLHPMKNLRWLFAGSTFMPVTDSDRACRSGPPLILPHLGDWERRIKFSYHLNFN